MFKLFLNQKFLIKSIDIIDIWKYIIESEYDSFFFIVDYETISKEDFCKLFLEETNNYEHYLKLESKLNGDKKIFDYA